MIINMRRALFDELTARGISRNAFSIEGVNTGFSDGLLELRAAGSGWQIGTVERGQFIELISFDSEEDAVKDFLQRFPRTAS